MFLLLISYVNQCVWLSFQKGMDFALLVNVMDRILIWLGHWLGKDDVEEIGRVVWISLGKSLFTGQLILDFYRGSVGKVQINRTVKNSDWNKVDVKGCV